MTRMLLLAAGAALSVAASAQQPAAPAKDDKVVEGATPGRVAQIAACQGRKFETLVEIDPVRKRSTKVKLCANPGATDADWAKTLEAAIAQMEQRRMPAEAKDKLIAELRAELAKVKPESTSLAVGRGASVFIGKPATTTGELIQPTERYEISSLPPLPPKKSAAVAGAIPGPAAKAQPVKVMAIRLKCLEPRESGPGSTCDFFERNTVLAVSAVKGLEQGGTLRFRRKGEERGEVDLTPMKSGQSARIKLPGELCRGISYSKVEVELIAPGSSGLPSARFGPYGLRC